eukprot:589154-Pyramimonas_sp.AAC.1
MGHASLGCVRGLGCPAVWPQPAVTASVYPSARSTKRGLDVGAVRGGGASRVSTLGFVLWWVRQSVLL